MLGSQPDRWAIGPSPIWCSAWTTMGQCAWRLRAPSKTPKSSSNSTSHSTRWPPTTGRRGLVRRPDGRERITFHAAWGGVSRFICPLLPPQTVVTLENGKLVQKQNWDGKETCIEREISDGKLIAVRRFFFSTNCASNVRFLVAH